MRNARAHKIQWSDPTVHSSTVTTLCMVNFTTANIYNVHENTLTCDLKNYMTPLRNLNRQVPVEKVLYWLSKCDGNRCRRISDKL